MKHNIEGYPEVEIPDELTILWCTDACFGGKEGEDLDACYEAQTRLFEAMGGYDHVYESGLGEFAVFGYDEPEECAKYIPVFKQWLVDEKRDHLGSVSFYGLVMGKDYHDELAYMYDEKNNCWNLEKEFTMP